MAKTSIEWTDAVWNPIVGCSKVSPGCSRCYAEKMATRLRAMGRPEYQNAVDDNGHWTGKITLVPERLEIPLKWKKPRRIFVNSMSDLFHEDVSIEFISAVWMRMIATPQHTYQILTKRPERMLEIEPQIFNELYSGTTYIAKNVWLGVSCEDQKTADERIPLLLQTLAAVRFVSLEPLLGPIDLWKFAHREETFGSMYDHRGEYAYAQAAGFSPGKVKISEGIDWVIVGGESGPHARPMHPDWVRSIRNQCQEAEVPFFFKQWGAYSFAGHHVDNNGVRIMSSTVMKRVGKKAAGRLLDGREWNEYPEAK